MCNCNACDHGWIWRWEASRGRTLTANYRDPTLTCAFHQRSTGCGGSQAAALSVFLFLSVAVIMGLKWAGVYKKIMSHTPVLQSGSSEAQLVGCLLAANQIKSVFREFLQDHCRLQQIITSWKKDSRLLSLIPRLSNNRLLDADPDCQYLTIWERNPTINKRSLSGHGRVAFRRLPLRSVSVQ